MSPRARLVLVVIALLALGATVLAALRPAPARRRARRGRRGDQRGRRRGPALSIQRCSAPAGAAGDFALRTQEGELVSLADLRGTVVVLSPTYATCDETCPVAAQQIRARSTTSRRPNASASARSRSASTRPTTRRTSPRSSCSDAACAATSTTCSERGGSYSRLARVRVRAPDRRARAQLLRVASRRAGRQRVGFPVNFLTPEALAHDLRLLVREAARS